VGIVVLKRRREALISREALKLVAEGKIKVVDKRIRAGKWKLARRIERGG